MADFDVAALAEQPILLAAGLGVLGVLLFIFLGRKSYGPVPSMWYPARAQVFPSTTKDLFLEVEALGN
jgi:hypothetical protein